MNKAISKPARKRKILFAKTVREAPKHPAFLERDKCFFMVWCVDGDEPKRIYRPEEASLAIHHAASLSILTGKEFHVLRSWRGFTKPDAD